MEPLPISLDLPETEPSARDAARTRPDTSGLTGPQKAAIVVRLLARQGDGPTLHKLPEPLQADLIRQVAALGQVSTEVVEAVADEFAAAVEAAALFGPGGVTQALDLLGDSVSASVAQRLRQQSGFGDDQDPWDRIAEKDAETLLPVAEAESVEVAAVLLSKLGVSKAAELLGMMPGERARRITYAISLTSGIRPAAVRRIGIALAGVLEIEPPRAFSQGPVERVGAILNSSRSSTRNEVLAGLDEDDADFAEEVRRAIFTFANIPERIAPRDISRIIRGVEQDVLVQALVAAQGVEELRKAADFVLGALSQRMADALRGEMEDAGEVDEDRGEEAMAAIVAVIREMEASGEIHLVAAEE